MMKIGQRKMKLQKANIYIHHDKKVPELAVDPSPVYKNSGAEFMLAKKIIRLPVTAY